MHTTDSELADPTAYHSLNMKLLYIATRTRPDILLTTSILATRSERPSLTDYDRLLRVLQYLNGTRENKMQFFKAGKFCLNAFVDASFNIHWDAKGQSGFCIFLDLISAAILVKSVKQKTTADSSTEAKLIALHEASKHICWIADVLLDLGYDLRPAEIFQDNKSAITMSSTEALNFAGRSKFINRKYFGIYEKIEDGSIKLTLVCTHDMIADALTKALVGKQFCNFSIRLLGQESIPLSE